MHGSCADIFRLPAAGLLLVFSALIEASEIPALASSTEPFPEQQAAPGVSRSGELGIEVGALTLVGTDLHLFYRLTDSPWMVGFRYLDYEDDFISNDYDDTDRETQTVAGPFVRYLFEPGRARTWYVAGSVYRVTQKIECRGISDEDEANGLFFGGGLMGRRDRLISYNLGMMFSPGMSLNTDNGDCASETSGGVDAVLSIMFVFN
ncbi:MAG: hypothetical protein PVI79_16760 [Gammaproteobacteria bacterium]